MGGFSTNQIILAVVALVAVIAVGSFVLPLVKRRKRAERIRTVVAKRRGELSRQQMEGLSQGARQRRGKQNPLVEMALKLTERLRLEGMMGQKKVRDFLAQAGIRGRSALAFYALARFGGIFVGAAATFAGLELFADPKMAFWTKVGGTIMGGVAGFYLPKVIITNKSQKRQQEMGKVFPDAMDLLVICLEAGLSIEGAFDRVTQEISESSPILGQEMGLATAELAFLGDRAKAYQNFADRTGLPAIKSLATAMIQSERYGTSVSQAVKVLAGEKRQERMSAAEKKAAALPAQLTVPMILFFLPVLFMVVIGPAILQISNM